MTRASERLATVFRGSVEIKKLAATMQLGDQPFVAFPQSGPGSELSILRRRGPVVIDHEPSSDGPRSGRRTRRCGDPSATLLRIGYGANQAVLRDGANPTGTRATSFRDLMSTTETSFVCGLAT